jgi:hypothetical protein
MSRPVLFVIDDDAGVVHALRDDLSRRFGEDFRVIGESSAAAGLADAVMAADFGLMGQKLAAVNRGPQFTFNETISSQIPDADQAKMDCHGARLSEGRPEVACGRRRTTTPCHGTSSLACSST